MFESKAEVGYFVDLLREAVERELLEVVVFSILTSHFHLLVRSPSGRLSDGMQLIEAQYCRAFNQSNLRDGPLVKGRFFSKRVEDDKYRRTVAGYIDWNPVDAGLIRSPEEYPFGSAWYYVRRQRPFWLSTEWLDGELDAGPDGIAPQDYRSFSRPSSRQAWVVEQRLRRGNLPDPSRVLASGPLLGAVDWFRERAELADGGVSVLPVASPDACHEAIALVEARLSVVQEGCPRRDLKQQVSIALCCLLSGLPIAVVAVRNGVKLPTAYGQVRSHRRMVLDTADYAELCAEIARLAILLTAGEAIDLRTR